MFCNLRINYRKGSSTISWQWHYYTKWWVTIKDNTIVKLLNKKVHWIIYFLSYKFCFSYIHSCKGFYNATAAIGKLMRSKHWNLYWFKLTIVKYIICSMIQMMSVILLWVKTVKIWINVEVSKVRQWIINKSASTHRDTNAAIATLIWFFTMSDVMSDEISLDQLEIESITGNYYDNFFAFISLCFERWHLWKGTLPNNF